MDKIEIINYVPKFLNFYNRATQRSLTEEERWELWKELYNFAAVPPGPEGQKLAKSLLNDAWEKYLEKLPYLENWKPDSQLIKKYLAETKEFLGYKDNINLVIIYFVGGFENNPFISNYSDGRIALCLPVESGDSKIALTHELTHIVHSKTANLKIQWERTIATTIIQEGLATQVSKYMLPGKLDEHYLEHREGWLNSCKSKRAKIIKGMYPYLKKSSSEVIYKFTFGEGTTNIDREIYFVGWEIVGFLLQQGVTFKEIANIQGDQIPGYLEEVYENLYFKNMVVKD